MFKKYVVYAMAALVCAPLTAAFAGPESAVVSAAEGFSGLSVIRAVSFETAAVPAPVPAVKGYELICAGGKLQVSAKDARRFNLTVNDAAMTTALRQAAAKFFQGEQYLMNTRVLSSSSFMVADLTKAGNTYDGGQFAPKLYLLGGGRARLTLTYFRMANSQSYDFKEVISFDFSGCNK